MSKTKVFRNTAIALAVAGPMTAAMATNGYFSHGYGMKAKGMGGAAVASTDSAFAGANNPAAAAWAGNRMEIGLDLFMPTPRGMERTNAGPLSASVESGSTSFWVPEFGYNRALSDKLGVGLTVYGNGGLNTDYGFGQVDCGGGPANVLCGSTKLGIDMMQLVIAPTVAYKVSDAHSFGVSPLIVHQQFKADGLQGFTPMSGDASNLTNNGYDTSNGVGVRLGYLGKINDKLTIGASYAPKIKMSKFSKYSGLFADDGNFDIPENYTVGMSYQASPAVRVALDYTTIKYSDIPSVGNPSTNMAPLGAPNGPGFGWADIDVWKLGVEWQQSGNLTLRAGLNVGDNPIQGRDVTFNILAPGVVTTHYTLGGTYALSKESELTMAYMYAPKQSVSAPSTFFAGTETISMGQQSIGIQYGWKF